MIFSSQPTSEATISCDGDRVGRGFAIPVCVNWDVYGLSADSFEGPCYASFHDSRRWIAWMANRIGVSVRFPDWSADLICRGLLHRALRRGRGLHREPV